jgi:hypothetical protein
MDHHRRTGIICPVIGRDLSHGVASIEGIKLNCDSFNDTSKNDITCQSNINNSSKYCFINDFFLRQLYDPSSDNMCANPIDSSESIFFKD